MLFSKPFDLLLELGRVNDAEHVAMEMLEMRPTGAALKRLALAKMIKGQPANARVVLNMLRDDLVWGRWAERILCSVWPPTRILPATRRFSEYAG